MRKLLILGALGCAFPAFANAQTGEGWRGQVTPYVWAAGLNGDVRPLASGPTLEVDETFFELLENSEGAFFISGLAIRGDLVFAGDVSWSSSSRTEAPGPGLPTVKGSVDSLYMTLMGGRRLQAQENQTIDLLAGVRIWDIDADVAALGTPIVASRSVSLADPLIGIRFNRQHTNGFSTIAYGDIGGFGIGSDFTAQLAVTVNYALTENAYVSGGYRYVHLDYEKRGALLDIRLTGPLLGLTWRFG